MAIIPTLQETSQQNVSSPVPIRDSAAARFPGEQLVQTGQAISQAGAAVGRYLQEQQNFKREIATSDGQSALNNLAKQSRDYANQNSQEDGSDMEVVAQKFAQDKIPEIMNTFGIDDHVKTVLGSYQNRVQNDTQTALLSDRVQKANKYQFKELDRVTNQNADTVYSSPSTSMVEAQAVGLNGLLNKVTSVDPVTGLSGLDTENVAKIKSAGYAKIGHSFLSGLIDKGDPASLRLAANYAAAAGSNPDVTGAIDPIMAKNAGIIDDAEANQLMSKGEKYKFPVMTSKTKVALSPVMTEVMNALTPAEKERYLDQISRSMKAKAEMTISDFHSELTAMKSFGLDGSTYISDQQVDNMRAKVSKFSGQISPTSQARMYNEITTIKAASDAISAAALEPEENFTDILSKMSSTVQSDQLRHQGTFADGQPKADLDLDQKNFVLQAQKKAEAGIQKMLAAREKDPVDFLLNKDKQALILHQRMKVDGGAQNQRAYYDYLKNKQEQLGISDPRVLSLADAEDRALTIEAQPDAQSIDGEMLKLKAEVGQDHFQQAVQELAETNKKVSEYATGMNFSREARIQLFNAMKNEDKITAPFDTRKGGDGTIGSKTREINDAMAKTDFSQIRKSLSNSSGGDLSTLDATTNMQKAVKLVVMSRLAADPTLDIEKETKKTYDKMIGSQLAVAGSAHGRGSSVLVPKNLGKDFPEQVKKTIQAYMDPDNIQALHPKVPADWAKKGIDEETYAGILAKQGRWETLPNQTGMRLVRISDDGVKSQVVNKLGQPIVKSFQDIATNSDPKVKSVKDSVGTFLGEVSKKLGIKRATDVIAPAASANEDDE